jgi:CubicO group peptidase (beta-lactamase class C family)
MTYRCFTVGLTVLITVLVADLRCVAEERPATGRFVERYSAFDQVVNDHMDLIGATAASLAINNKGRLVYSRGYGWSDTSKSQLVQPESTFRIASCTKPFTAATVRNLIRGGRLSEDTPVFAYLGIQPYNGQIGDMRLHDVTIRHLIEHKGGWDKNQTFDPTLAMKKIGKEMNIKDINSVDIIEYMLAQPLQNQPGEKRVYCNFGYMVLGRVIEKATGESFNDAVQMMICDPVGIPDLRISPLDPALRDVSEVAYVKESGLDLFLRDSVGGFATSAPSMCKFSARYWVDGKRRKPKEKRSFSFWGTHNNSTICLMVQRTDGIDYIVMLNSRRNAHWGQDVKDLRDAMNQAIDTIKAQ